MKTLVKKYFTDLIHVLPHSFMAVFKSTVFASAFFTSTVLASAVPQTTLPSSQPTQPTLPHSSTKADAKSLVETYRLAQHNNVSHQSLLAQYAAERLSEPQTRAGLLPKVSADISRSDIQYDDGNNQGLNLSQENLSSCLSGLPNNGFENAAATDLDCLLSPINTRFKSTSYNLRITQPIVNLPSWFTYASGKGLTQQSKLKIKQAELDLLLNTTHLFLNTLQARAELKIAKRETFRQGAFKTKAEQDYEQGLIKGGALLTARTHLQNAELQAQLKQMQYDNALQRFQHWIGDDREAAFPILTDLTERPHYKTVFDVAPPPLSEFKRWLQAAQQDNPDWALSELAVRISKHQYLAQKSQHAPKLDLVAQHSEVESDGRTPTLDEGQIKQQILALTVSMPLYTGGLLSTQTKQARWHHKQSQYQAQHIQQQLTDRIKQQLGQLNFQAQNTHHLTTTTRQQKALFESLKSAYSQGASTVHEVLTAESTFKEQQDALFKAQINYFKSAITFKRLIGTLHVGDLQSIDDWLFQASSTPNTLPKPADRS